MIAFKRVSKAYGKKTILSEIILSVEPKEALAIIGKSGSGKTTLLRLLTGEVAPTSGKIEVDTVAIQSLPPTVLQLYRSRLGVITQPPILQQNATVEENIALPLELHGAPDAFIRRSVSDLLKRLGLSAKAKALPQQLSLSEQALTAIARAVIAAPTIIVADEPFAHLEAKSVEAVTTMFRNMQKRGATVILLSEHVASAHALSARIVHLKDGKIDATHAESARATHSSEHDAHGVLEKKEHSFQPIEKEDEIPSPSPRDDGKKIRITAIGSSLQ